MNYGVIFQTLGWVLNIEAVCLVLPLSCALIMGENCTVPFLVTIALCLLFGILLTMKVPKKKEIYARDGFIIVALSWIVMSIFGALPFMFSGAITNFADALFEVVSGFTTTGASIIPDLDKIPRALLFWRSFTHWIGGMGVLVFLVAILPLSGGSNLHIMRAESPGPTVSKLVPKVKATAKILYEIYIVLTLIEIILLLCGGCSLFDSLTLSFGTAGTGGFAVKNSGLAEYSSYTQIVITVFMIIFGVNFAFYHLLLLRKFKAAFSIEEVRAYLIIIIAAITLISINCRGLFGSLFDAVKHSAFQVGSIITTTGYSTVDFNKWPEFSKTILVLLMFIGACAGSTGGGIKVSRILVLLKSIVKEVKILVHPRRAYKISMDNRIVEHETVRGINVFMAAYITIFVVSTLIISLDNFSFETNFTAVAATINNIGPGLGKVGPVSNFGGYSVLSTVVLTFNMLVGRLEIFPMLVLFSKDTWKK